VKQRGLLYLEAGQPAKATTLPIAADLGAARVGADLWIDEELTAAAIDERLARLEALARARFVAVGLTRPKPLVVQRLVAWSARLNPNELVLAPVSAVAAAPVAQSERAP
ncbi:MAG: divergent polysaccharide deacetylase family protein, partial [Rhodospirillales bacterium]|nr:divergent polysaccharide deacetylase family protein [Rhodospirillales bacterium]